jgi:uncharacterized repeat protein (TIGR03803 family)
MPVPPSFQTLYSFPSGIGSAAADAGMVLDMSGNLYGVIASSQALPAGAIFKFNQATGAVTTLHVFSGGADGALPQQTLVFDAAGTLYGTTEFGGDFACQPGGCGTVFKLDPTTQRMRTLHAFADIGADGAYPDTGALVFGAGGDLYGVTSAGGAAGQGTIYTIPPAGGTLTTLAAFSAVPIGNMAAGAHGSLYGATATGGPANAGTLFKLAPPARGQTDWTATTLYAFTGTSDGGNPLSGVTAGPNGALFGSTISGGNASGNGTLFRYAPATGTFTTLHRFSGGDGASPFVPLAVDAHDNLYGVTSSGGPPPRACTRGCGLVYEFSRIGFKLVTLHAFTGGADGNRPEAPLVLDATGAVYGTANGGPTGYGLLFKISP